MPAAPQSIQVPFTLRGRNPDVITCIANLSNDEVFTPPELANRMLDTLAEAWAANHSGANLWADKSVTFLDPCAKSGVFLREITRRALRPSRLHPRAGARQRRPGGEHPDGAGVLVDRAVNCPRIAGRRGTGGLWEKGV